MFVRLWAARGSAAAATGAAAAQQQQQAQQQHSTAAADNHKTVKRLANLAAKLVKPLYG